MNNHNMKLPRLSEPLMECISSNSILLAQNIVLLLTFLLNYQLLITILQHVTSTLRLLQKL